MCVCVCVYSYILVKNYHCQVLLFAIHLMKIHLCLCKIFTRHSTVRVACLNECQMFMSFDKSLKRNKYYFKKSKSLEDFF